MMDILNGCIFWWNMINAIWDKVSANIKKEFDSEPVYGKELLETKMKCHGDEVTELYDK